MSSKFEDDRMSGSDFRAAELKKYQNLRIVQGIFQPQTAGIEAEYAVNICIVVYG